MNRLYKFFVLTVVVASTSFAAETMPVQTGSPEAARQASVELIHAISGVPAEKIIAQTHESTENSAVVRVTTPAKVCILDLMKNSTLNKYGWEVKQQRCTDKLK